MENTNTITTTTTTEPITNDKMPTNFVKLLAKLDIMKEKLSSQKKIMDDTLSEVKSIEKIVVKMVEKQKKLTAKSMKPRKLCGFAVPGQISNELSNFMGIETNVKISRTEVTKFLIKYISEQNLQNPDNKKMILPDEKLWAILGDEAKDTNITHFTIQKYINKHFIKNVPPVVVTSVYTAV